MNDIDISASEKNDIERELKVEISSDADAEMQIMCDECSEISEPPHLKKIISQTPKYLN